MSAEEQRAQVRRLMDMGSYVITAGDEAQETVREATDFLKAASERLNTSRNFALAFVNQLDEMIAIVRALLIGSVSFEAFQALSNLERAREKMETYRLTLLGHIEQIDALETVIKLGVLNNDLREAKAAFRVAVHGLSEYNKGL